MSDEKDPLLTFKQHDRITVGTILTSSVLSPTNVIEFGNTVINHVNENPGINLLLNFEHVDYLSSAVLTELLRIHKAIEESKGKIRLTAVSRTILEVFEITNLNKMFTIHTDGLDADLKRFNRALDVQEQEKAWKPFG